MKMFLLAADSGTAAPNAGGTNSGNNAASPDRKRAAFNRRMQAEISETLDVVLAARRTEFAGILDEEHGITAADVTALEAKANQVATLLGIARTGDSQGQGTVEDENAAEDAIVAAIRRIQTGVRRTFPTSRANQGRYFIGADLENSEDELTRIAQTILDQLDGETLRGVGAPQKQRLQDALAAWKTAHTARGGSAIATSTDRARGLALMKEVNADRRDIQLAADGEWPYTEPENIPTRRAFHLPEKRPFVVVLHDN